MNKKLLTIFLSLFLVGILSVSCSNKDKTAPDTSTPKTIDPKYSGIWTSSYNPDAVEIDINGNIYEYKNSSRGAKGEIVEANDPTYKVKIYNDDVTIKFTDAGKATVTTKDGEAVYTKTSQGIEQYNGNSYVSTKTFNYGGRQLYFWVSVKDGKDGKAAMNADQNNNIAPTFPLENYFIVTGSGTDYSFSLASDTVVGSFKFAPDGNSITVRFEKHPDAPKEMLNTDIVCNKK